MSKKIVDFIRNISFSFLAYALPTAVLQFLIQPYIANHLGAEVNGQYLTLMSLNFFLIGITATVLNTVRLLQNQRYVDKRVSGDFNIILLFYGTLLVVVMPIGMRYYSNNASATDCILYVIIGLLYLYHDYIFAQYRLKLQYNKILVNNLILVVGYVMGLAFFRKTGKWELVFICAYVFTFIYDYYNTDFIKEPIRRTVLFHETLIILITLTISNFLTVSITYFDKLLLYPLLGGESVSIYNTASIVGKMLLMISAPLSSVFLSYLVQENELRIRLKKIHYLIIFVILVLAYLLCLVIGVPLTNFLYPGWASKSQILIPFTVASSLLLLFGNCINTVLVRFFKTYLQIVIQGIHLGLYLLFSLIGLRLCGLIGFCLGVCLSNLIRMVMVVLCILTRPSKLLKQ